MTTRATFDQPLRGRSFLRVGVFLLAGLLLAGAAGVWIARSSLRPTEVQPAPGARAAVSDTLAMHDGVVAYYFHTTYRCPSCRKIEANAKLAIETGFAGDLASGRLQWHVVNIEEKGNEHFVGDYQLYTKSLVLSEMRAGHEVRWKNLSRVWELLGDEPGFVAYVQKETHGFLDEMP